MDPKSELKAIQARLSALVAGVKSSGRDLTDAEAASIEKDSARAVELKAAIDRGERNAALLDAGGELIESFNLGGPHGPQAGAKGYLSAASIKAGIKQTADHGLKAVVQAGATAVPTALEQAPVKLGTPNSLGLLSMIQTKVRETPKYSFMQQVAKTNNAAVVASGATKPVSVFTSKNVDNELKVYAHMSEPVDKYLLRDNDDLGRFLQGELYSGVLSKVAADAIAAFAGASGIQTYATAAGYTDVKGADGINSAASKLRQLDYTPGLVIMGFDKYDAMRTAKATGSGEYLGGNYLEGADMPALWGIPTYLSPDIAAGTALVLDTSYVGISTDGYGIEVELNPYSGFSKNQIEFRGEGRFAFDVFRPEAIVKVTFTA